MSRYITKIARGAASARDLPRLAELLDECPEGYRFHSACPVADGGGYTSYILAIFEAETPPQS
jgi:hypothetical protein